MEGLYSIKLLTRTDKLYRLTRNVLYRECRTASGVTVKLCENYARDIEHTVEGFGNVDRVLTYHRIYREKYLGGSDLFLYSAKLIHKLLVDMKASRRVDKDHIVAL